MSTTRLGSQERYFIGPAADSLTELTGIGAGFTSMTRRRTRDHRTLPGRGTTFGALGPFASADHQVACVSNSRQAAALRDAHGQRRHYRYVKGGKQYSGEGIASVGLTLNPTTDACTFALAIQGDGLPTEAADASGDGPTLTPTSHKASMCNLYWGNASTIVHLNPIWQTALQIQGALTTTRRRPQSAGTGPKGITADVDACHFSAQLGLLDSATLETMEASPEGILVVQRADDSNATYCLPLVLRDTSAASSAGNAVVITCQLGVGEGSLPLLAASSVADVVIPDGHVGYVVNTDSGGGITHLDTGTADAPSNGFVVVGDPYVASNS